MPITRPKGRSYRAKKFAIVNEHKSARGCQVCRWNGDTAALDLHHVDPSKKEASIPSMLRSASIPRLLAEIAKCIVLCANCHRLLHAGRIGIKQHYRTKKLTFWPA